MVDSLPLEWIDSKNNIILNLKKEVLKLQIEKEENQWENINKAIQEIKTKAWFIRNRKNNNWI